MIKLTFGSLFLNKNEKKSEIAAVGQSSLFFMLTRLDFNLKALLFEKILCNPRTYVTPYFK